MLLIALFQHLVKVTEQNILNKKGEVDEKI
jgi:hypothetical protein